jgi:iron(III) transport system ATP-binding protein
MTVYGNVEYGLKNKKLSKETIRSRVENILELIQISEYKDRSPDKLSGGQQQRVALARAVVVQPQALLMDEPLSNLDAKLRLEMRSVISNMQKDFDITTIYVTHDQEEALAISDRIAVMNKGDIYQCDVPEQVYSRPYNTFVANFIGNSTLIDGVVKNQSGGKSEIRLNTGLTVSMDNLIDVEPDRKVLVSIRPEEFVITTPDCGMEGIVKTKQFLGKYVKYDIEVGEDLVCEVYSDTNSIDRIYGRGETVSLNANTKKINIFDKETETTLIQGVNSNV